MDRVVHTVAVSNDHPHFTHMIFCPGCKCGHGLCVGNPSGPNWTFNGNFEKPTFTPSLLVTSYHMEPPGWEWTEGMPPQKRVNDVCHSYITDGKIQFLDDCTHELRGKTVPLEPF